MGSLWKQAAHLFIQLTAISCKFTAGTCFDSNKGVLILKVDLHFGGDFCMNSRLIKCFPLRGVKRS